MKYLAILFLMLVFPTANSQESKASGKIVPFKLVEQPPVFEGCENEDRDCTFQKITNFFENEFKQETIADSLNGSEIGVKIILDETGVLAWQRIEADSPEVKEEAIRSLNELPSLIPAKHDGIEAGVMIDFVMKLNLFETPPYPEKCKDIRNKKECLSNFTNTHLFEVFHRSKRVKLKRKEVLEAEYSFIINKAGNVINPDVKGKNESFNEIVLNALKTLPVFYPATKAGEKAPYPLKGHVIYGKKLPF